MLGDLGGWHLLIILAVILLLFGATRLPSLAKGVGQSIRIFKGEMGASGRTVQPEDNATATLSPSTDEKSDTVR